MADNYKHLYEQMKLMVEKYQDEIVPGLRQTIEDLKKNQREKSRWIGFPNNGAWDLKCDKCHRIIPFGQSPNSMHYCPNCGADMRGDGE